MDSLKNFLLFFLCLAGFLLCTPACAQDKAPNILLFYADDLGWMDLGIQGSSYYETPNIDRIGKEGIRFTQAYANAANCAPSRACLMTGLYPPSHGVYTVGNPDRGEVTKRKLIPTPNKTVLDPNLLTLPTFLKTKGYRTAIAGKWHLSPNPLPYGFDVNFGGNQQGHPKSYFSPYQNPNLEDGVPGEHLPERLSRELGNWIRENHHKPFFAYFPFYSVHTPIQAREDLIDKFGSKEPTLFHNKPAYAAMIEAMDQAVGHLLTLLDELGLAENTLVIFTSDNGAHGGQTLSRPLRGSKGMFYEGGIRVPFLLRGPMVSQPGTLNSSPVIGSDIFPTLIQILAEDSDTYQLDGQSFLSALSGTTLPERALFWHFPAYLQMYNKDRAFEDSHDKPWFRTSPVSVIRKGNWKLLQFFEKGEVELYNLRLDIGEIDNLAEEYPGEAKELLEELHNWQRSTQAPIPSQKNPFYSEGK
ncbi:MAG: sulfatase [Bacteroidota bacterium]